jgi:uncharacterized RDD family membrane protein YckC
MNDRNDNGWSGTNATFTPSTDAGSGYSPPPPGNYPPEGNHSTYNQAPPPPQPYYYNDDGYLPTTNEPAPVVRSNLAGFGPRLVATLIDGALVGIPTSILYGIFAAMFRWSVDFRAETYYPSWSVQVIFWGLYAWFCYVYFNGNTVGKMIMNLKLVTADGSKPSLATYVLHYTVGYWLNGLIAVLGFIWVLFDAQKQTWGQKLFKDYTVFGKW